MRVTSIFLLEKQTLYNTAESAGSLANNFPCEKIHKSDTHWLKIIDVKKHALLSSWSCLIWFNKSKLFESYKEKKHLYIWEMW